MASIGTDRLLVRIDPRPDDSWLVTVVYIARFCQADIGSRYDDRIDVDEADAPGFRLHLHPAAVPFTATQATVLRKKRIVVRGSDLGDPDTGIDEDLDTGPETGPDAGRDASSADHARLWIRLRRNEGRAAEWQEVHARPIVIALPRRGGGPAQSRRR
ncbi:hypothetical protein [Mycolicibacterium palauense]|uniref:hypothetical protein n=1 Tax=Mycolicibacterium palauense TaxID=2034511 RepID=UPI000BFF1404|nr:hypothetical protein [Mycolicibacterium palauense]